MMNVSLQPISAPLLKPQARFQRRKIRKGTQSCWECKRRKVRCNFAAITDSVCDGCKRRKTRCVPQDCPDDLNRANSKTQLSERLGQLETVVNRLAEKVEIIEKSGNGTTSHVSNAENLYGEVGNLSGKSQSSVNSKPTFVVFSGQIADAVGLHDGNPDVAERREFPALQNAMLMSPLTRTNSAQSRTLMCPGTHDSISHALLEAWPSPRDFQVILDLPGEITGLFHGTLCVPLSEVAAQKPPCVREILERPTMRTHPVLIARKLLLLATYLYNLSPACLKNLHQANVDYRAAITDAVKNVRSRVTCNEELLGSIESIECLMIESMYQNNTGNLHNAWHSINRAILTAQMMGLHRSPVAHSVKVLDTETLRRIRPEYLWFRLVQMNRYLSLTLGLLQGTPNNSFADHHILKSCSPVERMQRLDCAAAGYILQRNESGICDMATTEMIDKMLHESAASLPPSWWLIPDLESSTSTEMNTFETIIHTTDQLTHFHLITQLHLPHLLEAHTNHENDYSKIMAVNASREVLIRFTALNDMHAFTSFCRGVNLVAFVACTALCILHIDASRQRQDCTHNNCSFLDTLTTQRQTDRGLMESTLKCMKRMACEGKDIIAAKIASTLDHLLSMEADTDACVKHIGNLSDHEAQHGLGCGGKVTDCGQILHIHIPYIGMVRFERINTSEFGFSIQLPLADKLSDLLVPGKHP